MREIQGYQKKDETLETTLRNLSRFFPFYHCQQALIVN